MKDFDDVFEHQKQDSRYQVADNENVTREDLEEQIAALRKRDRKTVFVAGLVTALMLAVGTVMYISKEANSAPYADYGYGYSSGASGSYAGYGGQYAVQPGDAGAAAGGCCGGGASGGGGGCGSGGGAAIGDASMADLEKQALAQYKEETGREDVEAKAADYGCHIQIDLRDDSGKIVRSYGFQGSSLYVII